MPPPGIRQTLLFSATFPNDIQVWKLLGCPALIFVYIRSGAFFMLHCNILLPFLVKSFWCSISLMTQKLASDFLSDYIFLSVGRVGSSTELIVQKIELVQDTDKRDKLVDHLCGQKVHGTNGKVISVYARLSIGFLDNWFNCLFPASQHALTLVFVETKRGADALESWLSKSGFPAIAIHGDKVQMVSYSAFYFILWCLRSVSFFCHFPMGFGFIGNELLQTEC